MKLLSDYVLHAPRLCYAAAVIIFLGYVGVGLYELGVQNQYAFEYNPAVTAARVRVVLDAFNYAFFALTSGFFFEIQIAIWSAVNARPKVEAAE